MTSQTLDSLRNKHASQEGLVSIVIPTYNRPSSLSKTLDSVFHQTCTKFEVIVVDDGSLCDITHVTANYPVHKVLRLAHSGANAARNMGYRESRGEYLLFLDDDVELDARFIEEMVAALNANAGAAFAYCSYEFDGLTTTARRFDAKAIKRSNYISLVSLIRRDRFPGFDPRIKRLQDWDLWLTMIEERNVGVRVPKSLFRTTGRNWPRITDDSAVHGLRYDRAYEIVAAKHGLLGVRYHLMDGWARLFDAILARLPVIRGLGEIVVSGLRAAGREGVREIMKTSLGKKKRLSSCRGKVRL